MTLGSLLAAPVSESANTPFYYVSGKVIFGKKIKIEISKEWCKKLRII